MLPTVFRGHQPGFGAAAFGMGVTRILWFKEAWWLTAGAILFYAAGYGMALYADYGSINV